MQQHLQNLLSVSYTHLAELEEWFIGILEEYKKWADFSSQWQEARTASIRQLAFPFPYREGQKELATYVYQSIVHKRKLFIEAPTGVGKTLSTVFPAVKALGEGKAERIFYLTAKTITRTVADLSLIHIFIRLKDGKYYMYYCNCEGSSPLSCMGLAVSDSIEAVSYTHLDVYKRQGLRRGNRCCYYYLWLVVIRKTVRHIPVRIRNMLCFVFFLRRLFYCCFPDIPC